MADMDALRAALEAALRALDAPTAEESNDDRRRRMDRERKRRARTIADTERGQNADRTRTKADSEQGFLRSIPSPPQPPRRGGGVECSADNSAEFPDRTRTKADADKSGRGRADLNPADEPARNVDPESWRGDFAPLSESERTYAKARLNDARAALRHTKAGA